MGDSREDTKRKLATVRGHYFPRAVIKLPRVQRVTTAYHVALCNQMRYVSEKHLIRQSFLIR